MIFLWQRVRMGHVNLRNTGTASNSKATLGKLLRDRMKCNSKATLGKLLRDRMECNSKATLGKLLRQDGVQLKGNIGETTERQDGMQLKGNIGETPETGWSTSDSYGLFLALTFLNSTQLNKESKTLNGQVLDLILSVPEAELCTIVDSGK